MQENDNIRNGWQKIFNKKLEGKEVRILNEEEAIDTLHKLKAKIEKEKLALSPSEISFDARAESWGQSLTTAIEAKGYSIGKSHWGINAFECTKKQLEKNAEKSKSNPNQQPNCRGALNAFLAKTDDEKNKIMGVNNFDHVLWLRDWNVWYKESLANGAPQAPHGQKSSDMNYRKPNRVYQHPQLQNIVNVSMAPLLAVLYAGREGWETLKKERPDIAADPYVKGFDELVDMKKVIVSKRKEIEWDEQEFEELRKSLEHGYKKPEDNQEPTSIDPSTPIKTANHAGPGRVAPEEQQMQEQQEQIIDISNQNKKSLNESWNKYQQKNKDAKNTEKPDDFTLLMG